jgi:hypothetical protein
MIWALYSLLEQRDLSLLTCWRLNTPKCPNLALTSTTARYEKVGYAKLAVVLTCKSHDSANLTTGHLKIKTGFRHRPTRRFTLNLGYDRLLFNGMLFMYGARLKSKGCS